MTAECVSKDRTVRLHDALRRTGTLLGDDVCSKEWISETRDNFSYCGEASLPRQRHRPTLFVTQLDKHRRHNPHSRLATIFRARHGQHDVCTVKTLLPEVLEPDATDKSAYTIEFQRRPVVSATRIKAAPVVPQGILPSCRIPFYDDVRHEMILPVEISEKSPSTRNANKYMPRRRRISDSFNQHRTHDTPYGKEYPAQSASPECRSELHFVTNKGKPLAHRRHLSAPPCSLNVKGFDGGAAKLTDNTMHAQLLPFLRGPNII